MYITHLMIIPTVIRINGYEMMMIVIDDSTFTGVAEGKVVSRV